ncbi:MAG: inositol monophosphatase family protein [Phycisphaerales bacterium]
MSAPTPEDSPPTPAHSFRPLPPQAAAAFVAVNAAARLTRVVQRRLSGADRIAKRDDTQVTIADYAAQAAVVLELRRALGAVVVVGEESAVHLRSAEGAHLRGPTLAALREACPGASEGDLLDGLDAGASEVPAGGAPFWTLDPIDGTKGFIRGHQYAVCLALIEGGRPTVAAMACPNLSEDFERPFTDPDPTGLTLLAFAQAGEAWSLLGAACGRGADRLRPVGRERGPGPLRFCQSFDSTHSDHTTTARLVGALNAEGTPAARPAGLDSQAKYAVLARGQADVLVRKPANMRRDWIWDAAPGATIATAAGLVVTDLSGAPLDYTQGRLLERNYGVIVADRPTHPIIQSRIATLSR